MIDKVAKIITKNPKKFILLSIVTSILFIAGIPQIKQNFSHRIWFRQTDPLLIEFDKFERKFGSNDSFVLVLYHPEGIFHKTAANALAELTEEVWQVKDVIRVNSLSTHNWSYSSEDDIIIEPFFSNEVLASQQLLNKRLDEARGDPQITNYLTSSDLKIGVINGILKPVFDQKRDNIDILKELQVLKEKYQKKYPDVQFHITGISPISATLEMIALTDLEHIIPLVFLITIITLALIFKSFWGVVLPLVIITNTVFVICGLAGWLGIEFNIMTSMIPSILLAICIADSIHLLSSYFHYSQSVDYKEAVHRSYLKNLKPTSLTTLTTSIGFFSLTFTDILPIQNLGMLSALGSMTSWFLTVFFLMPLVQVMKIKSMGSKESNKRKPWPLKSLINTIDRHRYLVSTAFLFIFSMSIYYAVNSNVNSSTMNSFNDELEIAKSTKFMTEKVGGIKSLVLIIKTDQPGGVKNPEFLKQTDNYIQWLRGHPFISKVSSMVDIIKQMNQSLNQDNKNYYSIPDSQEAIGQSLFLYELSVPASMGMNFWRTNDFKELRINIQYDLPGSSYIIPYLDKFRNKAKEMNLDMKITGKTTLVVELNNYIVSTFLSSMAMSILAIFIVMTIIFKSLKLGLISMIPNVFPPIFGLGVMSLFGVDLNVGTVLVTSVCLGICVDDTIYFISDYVDCQKQSNDTKVILFNVLDHTGRALVYTTITLVLSFFCFAIGDFKPNMDFGIITGIVLVMALICDFVLLPAVFLLLDRKSPS